MTDPDNDHEVDRRWNDREAEIHYQHGLIEGTTRGYQAGYQDHAQWIENCFAPARDALKTPTQDQLTHARAHTDQPCRADCGHCTACVRHAQTVRNLERYGSLDYPGGPVTP